MKQDDAGVAAAVCAIINYFLYFLLFPFLWSEIEFSLHSPFDGVRACVFASYIHSERVNSVCVRVHRGVAGVCVLCSYTVNVCVCLSVCSIVTTAERKSV